MRERDWWKSHHVGFNKKKQYYSVCTVLTASSNNATCFRRRKCHIEPVSRDLLGSDLDRGSNFAGTDSQNGVPAQL